MSPLPTQFTSRWDNRSRQTYSDAVCWHLLVGGDPAARAAAAAARQRLARFTGLHMTPPQWLHVTVMRVGSADLVTVDDMSRMLAQAQGALAQAAPITVTMRRVIYHPEAIALSVSPASALAPVLAAACTATREVLGADAVDGGRDEWVPHMTLCYSTTREAAEPVIAELGKTLPASEVTISEMSLVVQDGPEDPWNWRIAGSARLLGSGSSVAGS